MVVHGPADISARRADEQIECCLSVYAHHIMLHLDTGRPVLDPPCQIMSSTSVDESAVWDAWR